MLDCDSSPVGRFVLLPSRVDQSPVTLIQRLGRAGLDQNSVPTLILKQRHMALTGGFVLCTELSRGWRGEGTIRRKLGLFYSIFRHAFQDLCLTHRDRTGLGELSGGR